MLNYANLNDVEFEELCKDIMSKKLGINLRSFAKGRDGGIDLADKVYKPEIIVQVKHYIESSKSALVSSLEKEIPKVEQHKPLAYYVCVPKELSPQQQSRIYLMFSDYMQSSGENILTLQEIEDFLNDEKNIDILRKHYKLWIASTKILLDLFNNDIFVDCESLLATIHQDKNYFVQTKAYEEAINCLSKHNTLFLVGNPGVGKTTISKMLVLNYATDDYTIRYTTDVTDIASLKRSLARDKDKKEIILLDDCFGQAYFEMKSSQETELLSLIRFVNMSKNKLMILNSRVAIFREAKRKNNELVKMLENKELKVQVIDVSEIPSIEKAKILYNHMWFATKNDNYFQVIKSNKNYMKIIEHENYNPRLIEFISNPNRYKSIPPEKYQNFILDCLMNPHMVWDNEYEERMKPVDRCLLMTLFSLSNTTAPYELVEKCFSKRIESMSDIDKTVNQFEQSLYRVQKSFVKIVDINGKKKMSMLNPSINDYLEIKLSKNQLENEQIINSIGSIFQFKRLLPDKEANERIKHLFEIGEINSMFFESENEKNRYISGFIAQNEIRNKTYKESIYSYFRNFGYVDVYSYGEVGFAGLDTFSSLLHEELFNFYELDVFFSDFKILKNVLSEFILENVIEFVVELYKYFERDDGFIQVSEKIIKEEMSNYCDYVEVSDFDDIDISYHLDRYETSTEQGSFFDVETLIGAVDYDICEKVTDEIYEWLSAIPWNFIERADFDIPHISLYGVEDLVESYLPPDDDYERDRDYEPTLSSDIDFIFER